MTRTITAAAGLTIALATAAHADEFDFFATIDGSQEVPPNGSPAIGALTGTYDDVANTFSFSWDISDNLIGDPSSPGAHIHMAPAGQNGPIVFGFNNPDGTWPLSGSAVWTDLSPDDVDALFAGGLYVNFHTTEFPGGEVRGQILPTPSAITLLALGALGAARRRR